MAAGESAPGSGDMVCMIAPEYPPNNIGGGGVVVMDLAKEMRSMGAKVEIISGNYLGNVAVGKGGDANGLKWVPLVPTPDGHPELRTVLPPTPRGFVDLFNYMRRTEAGLFHLHGYGHLMVDSAALICRFLGRRYVITVHGLPRSPDQNSGLVSKVYSIYNRTVGRWILGGASRVTGISWSIVEELGRMGVNREKMTMVHNGIDLSRACEGNVPGLLDRFGLAPDRYVLAIGALHPRKGFHVLVRAFAGLSTDRGLKLAIVGNDAGYAPVLRELVDELGLQDRVVFTGYMGDEEKATLIANSTILAVPSLVEPFGLVTLEGLCGGACMVVSSADGIKEIVRSGIDGEVCPPGDVEGLQSAMQKVLDDPALARRYRENGPIRVKDFDLKRIAHLYLQVYSEVLSGRSGK